MPYFNFTFVFRDESIQSKISRIIKIWKERGVYGNSYLADLTGLLRKPIQKLKLADPAQDCQVTLKIFYNTNLTIVLDKIKILIIFYISV